MSWNPDHTTENCGFYAHICLHSCSWCWLAQPEPQSCSLLLRGCFFPSPHPQTAGNWTEIPSFSAVSLTEDVSCVHGISTMVRNFPHSFLETVLVFSYGSRSEMTQHFCALKIIFFIILYFFFCIGKEVGSSIYTFGEKKPNNLHAASCSGELWPSAASKGWFNPLNEAWRGKADRTLITGSWYYNYQQQSEINSAHPAQTT